MGDLRLIFSAFLSIFVVGCGQLPQNTVELFFNRLDKGNVKGAEEMVDPSIMRGYSQIVDLYLQDYSKRMKDCGHIKSISIRQVASGETFRSYFVLISYHQEHTNNDKCSLVARNRVQLLKKDDKWYLSNF